MNNLKELPKEERISKLLVIAARTIEKVQKKISKNGAYENAGEKETSEFMDKVRAAGLHYTDECRLSDYINGLVDNLNYSRK